MRWAKTRHHQHEHTSLAMCNQEPHNFDMPHVAHGRVNEVGEPHARQIVLNTTQPVTHTHVANIPTPGNAPRHTIG